jgi:hypothetical protein
MRIMVITVALAINVGACASEPAPVSEADYLADLQEVCAATTETLEALPQPPEQISVADFATSAASALDSEAERARSLEVPDEIGGDHRAFVLNTDGQAAAWRAVATAGDDTAALDELTVRIGELIRGRNDLVDDMGAPGCRRGDV